MTVIDVVVDDIMIGVFVLVAIDIAVRVVSDVFRLPFFADDPFAPFAHGTFFEAFLWHTHVTSPHIKQLTRFI